MVNLSPIILQYYGVQAQSTRCLLSTLCALALGLAPLFYANTFCDKARWYVALMFVGTIHFPLSLGLRVKRILQIIGYATTGAYRSYACLLLGTSSTQCVVVKSLSSHFRHIHSR